MTSLSMKEYNEDIEFIEQYPRHDYIALGSLWYSVNDGIDVNFAEEFRVGLTD